MATAPTAEVIQAGCKKAAYCDLLLSIPTTTTKGEIAFWIFVGAVNTDHPQGNAKIAWYREVFANECKVTDTDRFEEQMGQMLSG